MIFSTLNRTARSFAMGIVAAEYLLGWVPRGTHDWKKFVTPAEMTALLGEQGFEVGAIAGLSYDLLGDRWHPSHDCGVNYIAGPNPLKPAERQNRPHGWGGWGDEAVQASDRPRPPGNGITSTPSSISSAASLRLASP
ncbi:hypothetical protein JCM17846_29850 [Iodidimonas nitroreducens]|uniref:3-demethylubiquinone-9 3-methyltransferase n=1 Tax=Iodidimonas nitroreducens TaxID=1236968 RepID=A0A5A7NA99_9PROT|nr:hypothetical protein [Iodidimonas nitroreducens]GER05303.1 hypothetical protein JCM17846_29850 [Iodidimonas nitroreducens]